MFAFGLIAAICSVPGYTGAAIPTQWAVFSIALPMFLWQGEWRPQHTAFAIFLAWATLGLAWTKSRYDGVYDLWIAAIWFLAFWFGGTQSDLRPLWRGLAVGLGVSSTVAIAQSFGWRGVPYDTDHPAGLFYNSTALGAYSAVIALALIAHRQWFYLLPILPGLALSHSRGAIAVLVLATAARYLHWTLVLAAVLLGATWLVSHAAPLSSDADRLDIWYAALSHLTFFGLGPGSFSAYYYVSHGRLFHPGLVHNDFLQLWYHYGPAALIPATLAAMALRRHGPDRLPLFGCILFGLFWFPISAPITALVAFTCAGHLLIHDVFPWPLGVSWRSLRLSWLRHKPTLLDHYRRLDLPVGPRT